jgi:hypothetical protein
MRKQSVFISIMLLAVLFIIGFNSCKEDEPVKLTLVSLEAGAIDLNAATAPDDVPVDAEIVATFSTNVDPATATSANIVMLQVWDNTNIDLTITVSGKTVTIVPASDLGTGSQYLLTFNAGLMSTEGEKLITLSRSFTTAGTFAPSGAIAHWTFEDNANDIIGNFDPTPNGIVGITYTASRNAEAGKAATFDGDISIIEIPNGDQLIDAQDFTISFWVKTNSDGHTGGHFVLGIGAFYGIGYEIYGGYDGSKFGIRFELADGGTASDDMWFPSLATDNTTGGWQGWDYAKSLTAEQMMAMLKDTWLHVVYTFNGTTKQAILYFNGVKMKSFDFDLWPDGDAKRNVVGMTYAGVAPEVVNEFAFGFIQSRAGTLWDTESWGNYDNPDANHFKGQLDDVRIFHKALTATGIDLMYQSEKP